MTEEACKALDRLREGNPIECSADAYHSEIRDALILFALDCADSNDGVRMRIALAEVNRLDNEHGYGVSAVAPNNLA
ncbi:MAG TPA: hypothetical protein VJZ77_24350 [Blastocatellia bacterium]|nr:hypothetical protein [Blastocatellia bacterium]